MRRSMQESLCCLFKLHVAVVDNASSEIRDLAATKQFTHLKEITPFSLYMNCN